MKNHNKLFENYTGRMRKFSLFAAILLILCCCGNPPSAVSGRRYYGSALKTLFNSDTRKVTELASSWEMSSNGKSWSSTQIPSALNAGRYSKILYRTRINIARRDIGTYSWALNFMGVADNIEVFFNDEQIGKYFGGMTQFEVKIPQNLIRSSGNTLRMEVTPSNELSGTIREQNIFTKDKAIGLPGEVFLIGYPQVWTSNVTYNVNLSKELNSADISSGVTISSGQITALVKNFIPSDSFGNNVTGKFPFEVTAFLTPAGSETPVSEPQNQTVVLGSERTRTLRYGFHLNDPKLWSPASPNLYELHIKISFRGMIVDQFVKTVGIDRLRIMNRGNGLPGQFYLNGNPFELKGIDYIADYAAYGPCLSPERIEKDVIAMKTLGANFVRCKFGAPHPYFIAMCNKYGLFVSVDAEAYMLPSPIYEELETQSRMRNTLERLTRNFDCDPCIFAYCLFDGIIEGSPRTKQVEQDMISAIRKVSHKFIYKNVLIGARHIETEGFSFIGVKDEAKYRNYSELNKKIANLMTKTDGKPIVISFGFPFQIGNSNGYTDPQSIEAVRNYMLHVANLVYNNKLAGMVYWAFNDYPANFPLLVVNNDDQEICSVGLFSRSRQRRISYSTLQGIYTGSDDAPILTAGSYSASTPAFFIAGGIILLLLIVFYAKRYRRFREYFLRSVFHPYNFYADIRDQRVIALDQTILLSLASALSLGLFSSAVMYYLRDLDIIQELILLLLPIRSIVPGLFRLIWQPVLFTLLVSFIALLAMFATAGIIRLLSLFVIPRIFYNDAVAIVGWASTPLIILLPLSIFVSSALQGFPSTLLLFLIIQFGIMIWALLRVIKATVVVFDIRHLYGYSIAAGGIFVILTLCYTYLNLAHSFAQYLNYLYKYISNT